MKSEVERFIDESEKRSEERKRLLGGAKGEESEEEEGVKNKNEC